MDDLVCSSCGTGQHPAATYCGTCGSSFAAVTPTPALIVRRPAVRNKKRRRLRRKLVIGLAAAGMLAAPAVVVAAWSLVR